MKIIQINTTCGSGSTGKICLSISQLLSSNSVENYILFSSGSNNHPNGIRYASNFEIKASAFISRVIGNFGFASFKATRRMIKKIDEINPDIIHLHNIHSHDCNLEMLFRYIKNHQKTIIWTFHDCWAFTGSCTYFTIVKCDKWKKQCEKCPNAHEFSWFFDCSKKLFLRKKRLLTGLNMTIVTPSQWLADLVKESFLKGFPVEVIHNGIDLTVFKPRENSFREKYQIGERFILLGVAFGWERRKGLDVFIELSKRLDPEKYQIILVGTDKKVDKQLPDNIISIHRTQNQRELAEIYTAADVFVNPTREDNYPTVNMEAISCGTPVITFDTGGSPEMVDDSCGIVIEPEDIDGLVTAIQHVVQIDKYPKEACLKKAFDFDQESCFRRYVELYQRMTTT